MASLRTGEVYLALRVVPGIKMPFTMAERIPPGQNVGVLVSATTFSDVDQISPPRR
jgi:hypothetical protein